jgi:signal transduction histidine kinase
MQVVTSLLVLGLFIAAYIMIDIKSYKQRKVNNTLALAHVIGTNSISTLEFDDNEAAANILSELQKVTPEIIYAAILDKTGNLFADYTKRGTSRLPIPDNLEIKSSIFKDKHLFVSNNIIKDNELIGKIIIEVELTELEQINRTRTQVAAILFLIAFICSFLIAIFLQSYISRRLLRLVKTMDEVSKTGDYDKSLKDAGKDEIGTLFTVFNNMMLQVKENQQRKDDFIGVASHELKTPLTSIKGYIELLNDTDVNNNNNKQIIQKALTNVNKLERLIRDLLDVSKIQSGQLELHLAEFDIDQMLTETISSLQMLSHSHKIIRKGCLQHQVMFADKQRIEQVLTNLISNAIKYSPGEREIIVYSQEKEGEWIVRIRDFGIGIPQEEQYNVFDRFYRPKEIAANFSGFGLGLYICKDIITRHGGKIWIETEVDGTSFYFSLPLKKLT